jgi:hypothetical protein
MSEICIPEAPVFRDEHGFNLVVQSTADTSLFGGRGGEFRSLQRVRRYGTCSATERSWNPQTYWRDEGRADSDVCRIGSYHCP